MATIQRGSKIRQVLPAPREGVVSRFDISQTDGAKMICMDYIGEDGEVHQQFFTESEVELME